MSLVCGGVCGVVWCCVVLCGVVWWCGGVWCVRVVCFVCVVFLNMLGTIVRLALLKNLKETISLHVSQGALNIPLNIPLHRHSSIEKEFLFTTRLFDNIATDDTTLDESVVPGHPPRSTQKRVTLCSFYTKRILFGLAALT